MLPDHIQFSSQPGQDLRHFLNTRNYSQVMVLTDENTSTTCLPALAVHLPAHTHVEVPSGEAHKTLDTCVTIWNAMTEALMDRHSVLVVVGGGVLGDMGGFCAATYKRGIDFILVPTTLLAQVDASIGGKLGIDFQLYKNHIGVFQEPALTLLHDGFLRTLPRRELASGFAEVIKHTLISDAAMWNTIRQHTLESQPWQALLTHSADFKYSVIRQDPREKGLRKILNAGHTIGHAVETWCLASGHPILHGEAVAAGLIMEAFIAAERHMLTGAQLQEITTGISTFFQPIAIPEDAGAQLVQLAKQDKKNKGNTILAVLLDGIGSARWACEITDDAIRRSLSYYRSLDIKRI